MTRRRLAPLALLVAVVGASAGCGGDGADDATAHGAPPALGPCHDGETPSLQGGSHLLGETTPPVPYSSTPPTSGWHAGGAPPAAGVAPAPLREPEQVSVLEAGGVVAAYDPRRLPASEVAELERLATEHLAGRLTVTPYEAEMATPLALTAWGVLQRCDAIDVEAITAFVLRHHGRAVIDH